jgi:hypothetical protein
MFCTPELIGIPKDIIGKRELTGFFGNDSLKRRKKEL